MEKTWIKNFYGHQAGYHILAPFFSCVIPDANKLFDKPRLTECFGAVENVELLGAYFIEREIQTLIQNTIKLSSEEPEKIEKLHKENYQLTEQYFKLCKGILTSDLTKLSKKELGKLYANLIKWQEKSHQHAIITTWFIDSEEEQFSKFLLEKTRKIIKKLEKDLDFAEVFSLLTTLPKNSMNIQEEIESLQLLKKIAENEGAKQIFINLKEFSKIPRDIDPAIKKAIQNHYEKWRWIPFGFLGPAYNIDYYLSVWSGLLKEGTDINQEIEKLINRPEIVQKERDQFIKELGLNKKDKQIYNIAANIVFLKGYRKEVWFFGCYVLDKVLKEVSKRTFLSLNQLHLISHEEMEGILVDDKEIDLNKLNERKKFTIIYQKIGESLKIWSGKKAKEFLAKQKIKEEEVQIDVQELHGTCACNGTATGIVKIVNTPGEIDKMEKGDIMVSHTTYPSLVPAMKKAAAIVTEDGGITCHAAIVSREMGTPCVTGIKTATQVLKDGDEVEVDANQGIVRKLN